MDVTKAAQSTPESQLHFLDYWRIIRIRKTVILAVFLLVVLTTTAVTFVLHDTYLSTARISVEKDSFDIDPLGRANTPAQFDPYYIQTQFEKIQSTTILYKVIQDLELNKVWAARRREPSLTVQETYILLRKSLDVRQSRNTTLIEIRVYDEDKDEAANIANKIAEVYQKSRVSVKENQSKKAIKALDDRLKEQTAAVRAAQMDVDRLRTELQIPDSVESVGAFQSSLERERVSGAEQERQRVESQYVYYYTQLTNLVSMDRETLRKAVLTAVPTETLLSALYTDLAQAEQRLATLTTDYAASHPDVVRMMSLKQKIEKQIQDRLDGVLTGLSNQVLAVKARYDAQTNALAQAKSEVAEAAKAARPYFTAKRDLESQQRIRDAIYLRTMQEAVDATIPMSSIVEIIDNAEPGARPVRPNFPLNIALGVIVGLVMGVGLAFFIEYLDTSVKTIDDVERALQAPVLGVIPQNVGALMHEGPDSPHAEAYRVLRTNVLFSRKDPNANTLTVVSGGAGEGKSTTIFNLATVFAQNGQRVLVVDSDLRRPSLHKFVNVSNTIGLTNYLLKQNTLEEVIQTTKVPTMDFMASGKLPSSSLGILNSARMKEFIKDVKARYDFVFFDSPPIMGVSDASILASEVDLALLVVQYRKYPQAMTLRAKQMVEKVGGTMLGVVLNNINISQDSYYYYYSGYYYDYYSKQDDQEEKKDGDVKKNGEGAAKAGDRAAAPEIKRKY